MHKFVSRVPEKRSISPENGHGWVDKCFIKDLFFVCHLEVKQVYCGVVAQ